MNGSLDRKVQKDLSAKTLYQQARHQGRGGMGELPSYSNWTILFLSAPLNPQKYAFKVQIFQKYNIWAY